MIININYKLYPINTKHSRYNKDAVNIIILCYNNINLLYHKICILNIENKNVQRLLSGTVRT